MARTTLVEPDDIDTLRALVLGAGATQAWRDGGDDGSILVWLNGASNTDAWRVSVQPQDTDEATPWDRFDNVVTVQARRDAYLHRFFAVARDFSKNAVRKWIADAWGNTAEAQAILQAGIEKATRAQNAVGGTSRTTGSGGTAVTALDRTFIGTVTMEHVIKMRGAGW